MNKQQLASRIWASANEIRSKIEASEYKDYILGFIFYKFLSEKEEEYLLKEGFDSQTMKNVSEDDQEIVKFVQDNVGYFIAYENLYSTWLSKGHDFDVSNVSDALSAFSRLVNPSYSHVFDRVFETLETGLSKLGDTSGSRTKAISGLLQLIRDIPMDARQGYDVLGYIYEYLISNFAANAGKKAGEFYTPHEVSLLMSEIVAGHLKGRHEIEIYDPTSGSGSLLVNIGQAVAKRSGNKDSIKYYAQELKENTYNLTRMNLVMRGIKASNIIARNGDTLEDDWPWFSEGHPETYQPLFVDAVVSNPPYSQRWDPTDKEVDPRFNGFGLAPKSKADYAFLLHDLYHLRPDGIMTIVLPHGVLFRGGEEGEIRRNLIERDHIDAIIGLPANIFFGTGIPTIVMVLKKQCTRSDVLIIDASKGYVKEGKNNKLRASDIRRIVDAYECREDIERFCRLVSKDEIRGNDYNLNIPRYVDSSETTESWDIYSTMFGGIPVKEVDALKPYWDAFPGLKYELFEQVNEATMRIKAQDVGKTIASNAEVVSYQGLFKERFSDFEQYLYDELIDEIDLVSRASEEDEITKEVFNKLSGLPLIDRYDAFQDLDDVWQEISIDLEILQTEGFDATKKVDPNMVVKKKQGKDVEVQDGWVGRVLPFSLVQNAFLTEEVSSLEQNEERLSAITAEITEIFEGLSDEDKDAAGDAVGEDSFVSSKISAALKQLKDEDPSSASDEESILFRLTRVAALFNEEKVLKKTIKDVRIGLEKKTKEMIESLTDEQVCTLLDEKWIKPLVHRFEKLPDRVVNQLNDLVKALGEKYLTTYSDIDSQIQEAEASLAAMLGELTGNEFDLAGLNELRSLLGGEL
ncbi:type I restriction-modification system subunit M [Lancefieldella rimae]|uniref:type I restriction-modification system subunit M n=1 Tax=Lancefieldella rimae TaxID=1383 RepID=UPI003C6ED369